MTRNTVPYNSDALNLSQNFGSSILILIFCTLQWPNSS
jgi:hypothetical protein